MSKYNIERIALTEACIECSDRRGNQEGFRQKKLNRQI